MAAAADSPIECTFVEMASFLRVTGYREEGATTSFAEATLLRLDAYIHFIQSLLDLFRDESHASGDGRELLLNLEDLSASIGDIYDRWRDIEVGVNISSPSSGLSAELRRTVMRGRPKYIIRREQLVFLWELRFTWTKISKMYGVSRRTLYNIRCEFGLTELQCPRFSVISDQELRSIVAEIKHELPDIGQTMLKGVLESRNIYIPTTRLRDCLSDVVPVNTTLRWSLPISRRIYSVPGSNALWHLDGNHKLIRWRFVIHGAIDGFSRFVVYLHCCTNNRSETVLALFHNAVIEFGLPQRVRSDKGGENVKVAEYMLVHGYCRNPMLTGSSVHNQRVERLWRDTYRCVLSLYYQIFYYLEDNGHLDSASEIDLFCLHFVYEEKINESLKSLVDGWKSHALSTKHNMTPVQLFVSNLVQRCTAGQINTPRDYTASTVDEFLSASVEVPRTSCPLSQSQQAHLRSLVMGQMESESDDYGIQLYKSQRVRL